MATKITTGLIANDAITSAHIGATAITHADLHTNMDLTGKTVLVANASTGDNDTTAANTAFVQQELAALVDSAPGTLNTLNELAAALGDDAAFSTTVTNSIATKLPLAGGTMTGHLRGTTFGTNLTTTVGVGGTPADSNTAELGPGYLNLARDDTADAKQLLFGKNGAVHSYLETTSSGLNIGGSNVGIGTTSPSEELHVSSALAGQHTRVHVTKTATAGTAGISFNTTSSANTWTLYQEDASASKFYFYDGAASVMTLDSANNRVGIGTDNPTLPLDVQGTGGDVAYFRGDANNTMRIYLGSGYQIFQGVNSGTTSQFGYGPNGFYVQTGGGNTRLNVANDGKVTIGTNPTNTPSMSIEGAGKAIGTQKDKTNKVFVGLRPYNIYDFGTKWSELHTPATSVEYNITSQSYNNEMGVNMNHPGNVTSSVLRYDHHPRGGVDIVAEFVSNSTNTWNGGFNSNSFAVDPDKCYMFGYYFRRTGSSSAGTHYFGFSHGVAAGTGTNVDSNPYFLAQSFGTYARYQWHVIVAYLYPRYYTGSSDPGGYMRTDGVWNLNGDYRGGVSRWKSPMNQTTQTLRAYNYYCADPNMTFQYAAPFVYECNGSQPTLGELLIGNERIGE